MRGLLQKSMLLVAQFYFLETSVMFVVPIPFLNMPKFQQETMYLCHVAGSEAEAARWILENLDVGHCFKSIVSARTNFKTEIKMWLHHFLSSL